MDDLIAFLRARLDEDEQAAAAASDGPWTPWRGTPGLGLPHLEHAVALPGQNAGARAAIATASWLDAEHIARHDPARALREVEAKRRIMAECIPSRVGGPALDLSDALGEVVLLFLALPYSDHPDYREEWAP